MASNLRKASSAIKKSFRTKRYSVLDIDENNYIDASPRPKNAQLQSQKKATSVANVRDMFRSKKASSTSVSENQNPEDDGDAKPGMTKSRSILKRGTNVTESMREAVGSIREKFRTSTRRLTRLHNQATQVRAGKRRHSMGAGVGKDVKMSSPFKIDTPSRGGAGQKSCLSLETPTRLRREVEALTSNMQALSALTPNTLQARARARRAPPLTNGSLKTPRATRRSISTDIL